MTDRINVVKSGPSTRFIMDADRVETQISANRSRVRNYIECLNGPQGTTGSLYGGAGLQRVSIDGVDSNVIQRSASSNFLASGFAANQRRWYLGPADTWVDHASNGTRTIVFRMTLDYGSINESHTYTMVLPNIPITPTGLAVERLSDTQQKLTWTRNSDYTGVPVQRSTDDGPWQQIAAPTGNVATYTDTTTSANHKYEYRVAGKASAGQSAWSNIATVYTTPAAPTGVSAARNGDDIVVSVSGTPPYATAFDVRDGSTVVGSGVSLPWTHADPDPAVPHTYTVRATRGSLTSAYSSPSNTVQLLSAPNPPGGLSPNGQVRADDLPVVFQWTHNPVDSSPQSAYELRHRPPGGSWTVLSGTTASSRSVSLPVGGVEWEVRTKGQHPDWSGWSATATVTVIDRPGVAVISPESSWDSSVLTVDWSWLQAQSRPQSGWEARLLDAAGDPVETRSGSGAASSVTFTTRLFEGAWTVQVRGATGDVWSGWAEQGFTVAFIPPAAPVLSGVWDEGQGGVLLEVTPAPAGVVNLFANPSFEDASPIPAGASRVSTWASDGAWSIQIPTDVPSAALLPGASTYPS